MRGSGGRSEAERPGVAAEEKRKAGPKVEAARGRKALAGEAGLSGRRLRRKKKEEEGGRKAASCSRLRRMKVSGC